MDRWSKLWKKPLLTNNGDVDVKWNENVFIVDDKWGLLRPISLPFNLYKYYTSCFLDIIVITQIMCKLKEVLSLNECDIK